MVVRDAYTLSKVGLMVGPFISCMKSRVQCLPGWAVVSAHGGHPLGRSMEAQFRILKTTPIL